MTGIQFALTLLKKISFKQGRDDKMKKVLLTVCVAILAMALPAAADTITVGSSLTYNYSATTPGGTITASVTYTLTTAGHLTVNVTNTTGLSGGGTGSTVRPALTAVG